MIANVGPDPAETGPVAVLVLALGEPLAPGEPIPALLPLGGSTLLQRLLGTLEAIETTAPGTFHPAGPVVVAPRAAVESVRRRMEDRARVMPAAGTDRRSAIRGAFPHLDGPRVLVHEAERALVPAATLQSVLSASRGEGSGADATVPALAVTDSVKSSGPGGLRNVDRGGLVTLQAPRLLRRTLLEEILARPDDALPQDEILAALELGARVIRVPGSHQGGAVSDRLGLWSAQISLGLARDVAGRRRAARRG